MKVSFYCPNGPRWHSQIFPPNTGPFCCRWHWCEKLLCYTEQGHFKITPGFGIHRKESWRASWDDLGRVWINVFLGLSGRAQGWSSDHICRKCDCTGRQQAAGTSISKWCVDGPCGSAGLRQAFTDKDKVTSSSCCPAKLSRLGEWLHGESGLADRKFWAGWIRISSAFSLDE